MATVHSERITSLFTCYNRNVQSDRFWVEIDVKLIFEFTGDYIMDKI